MMTTSSHRVKVACSVVLSVALLPFQSLSVAWAQNASSSTSTASSGAERGAALKKLGDQAMDSLHYAEAVRFYTEAYAASPDPALVYNKGRALQALDDYPSALTELERFAKDAPPELKARVPRLNELITELRGRVATLAIGCNVTGARIIVRGRVVATTPLEAPLRVVAGRALLEVLADGYTPYRRELTLPGGRDMVLDVELLGRDKSGILSVRTLPKRAGVFLDGKPLGQSPLEVTTESGTHGLLVKLDGYEDMKTSVVVPAGERKEVQFDLEPNKGSVLNQWWFWAGLGVVVAGGIATTYALTTEKKASTGTIGTGSTSAPLIRF